MEYMHGIPDWPQALLPYEGERCSVLQRRAKVRCAGQGGLPLLPSVVAYSGFSCQSRLLGGMGVQ